MIPPLPHPVSRIANRVSNTQYFASRIAYLVSRIANRTSLIAAFRVRPILLVLLPFILFGGCRSGNGETPPSPVDLNLFRNPSFESGSDPWFSMTTAGWGKPFSVSNRVAHSGESSALIELRSEEQATGTKVIGVVQEIAPETFPEALSGYYRVEEWKRGAEKQYLQFAVIVFGQKNFAAAYPNVQIRYILAAQQLAPFSLTNAKFVFIDTDEPSLGEWIFFERPIAEDFKKLWGDVPREFDTIRILFEARYDGRLPSSPDASADVFYDDLYVGPAQ